MHDVIVIGGGPGGLFAAERLARCGFDVVVLEEHEFIGRPVHCTGILAIDAFREFDLPTEAILNELHSARFFSPSGQDFAYTPSRVEAVVVDRVFFDELMSRRARAAGAAIMTGRRVSRVHVNDDSVRIMFDDADSLAGRACIVACGANYGIQRALGLGAPLMFLQSAQAEVPSAMFPEVEIHFGERIAPKGFAWVVPVRRPHGNYVRLGIMSQSKIAAFFGSFLRSVADRCGIPLSTELRPRQKILPLAPIKRTFGERLLVVGDAAGLVKPTTGGGIYYSVVSAAIAAEVLQKSLRANRLDASSLQVYEHEWRRRLGPELDAQLMFRTRVERLLDNEIDELFDLVRADGIIPLIQRKAAFNQHRHLIFALFQHSQFRHVILDRISAASIGPRT